MFVLFILLWGQTVFNFWMTFIQVTVLLFVWNYWLLQTRYGIQESRLTHGDSNHIAPMYKRRTLGFSYRASFICVTIRITNRCGFLYYVFISFFSSFPYMFRAFMGPSSGVFQAHESPKHVGKRGEKGNKDIVQKVASVGNSYCNTYKRCTVWKT